MSELGGVRLSAGAAPWGPPCLAGPWPGSQCGTLGEGIRQGSELGKHTNVYALYMLPRWH